MYRIHLRVWCEARRFSSELCTHQLCLPLRVFPIPWSCKSAHPLLAEDVKRIRFSSLTLSGLLLPQHWQKHACSRAHGSVSAVWKELKQSAVNNSLIYSDLQNQRRVGLRKVSPSGLLEILQGLQVRGGGSGGENTACSPQGALQEPPPPPLVFWRLKPKA